MASRLRIGVEQRQSCAMRCAFVLDAPRAPRRLRASTERDGSSRSTLRATAACQRAAAARHRAVGFAALERARARRAIDHARAGAGDRASAALAAGVARRPHTVLRAAATVADQAALGRRAALLAAPGRTVHRAARGRSARLIAAPVVAPYRARLAGAGLLTRPGVAGEIAGVGVANLVAGAVVARLIARTARAVLLARAAGTVEGALGAVAFLGAPAFGTLLVVGSASSDQNAEREPGCAVPHDGQASEHRPARRSYANTSVGRRDAKALAPRAPGAPARRAAPRLA